MNNPAAVADVQARFLRVLSAQEATVAGTLLGDAWIDLREAVPTLEGRLTAVPTAPADADLLAKTIRVLAEAVKRVLLNPFARKQESRAVDDANRSWTLADGIATGALYFTDAELDSLRDPAATGSSRMGKAFSVMPKSDVVIDPTVEVPLPWYY